VIRLSTAVQNHPSRAVMAAELAAAAGGADVVSDPDPLGKPDPWRTYRACLEATPGWATHRLVLQDDALVCARFRDAALAAASARPGDLLALFASGVPDHRDAVLDACRRRAAWCVLDTVPWVPAVALLWPAGLIPKLLAFVDRQGWPAHFTADDEKVWHWAQAEGVTVWATVPSLVQHPDDVPSTLGMRALGGRDPARVAAVWAGDLEGCDDPASQIDWAV
jgi:hypothetical protein